MAITISVDHAIVKVEATSIVSNLITALSGDSQLFIMVTVDDITEGDITSISDSEGETITQLANFLNGNRRVRLYSIANPNLNARTITVNFGSATDAYLDLFTVQGSVTDADPSDVTATSNANNTSPDTAITPNASTGMIIWLIHQSSNSSYTALGTGQSERGMAAVGGAEKSSCLFTTEIFTAAPGNQTATASKSGNWIGLAVEIKESAGVAITKLIDETENVDDVNEVIVVRTLVRLQNTVMNLVEVIVTSRVLVRLQNSVINLVENITKTIAKVLEPDNVTENIDDVNEIVKVLGQSKEPDNVTVNLDDVNEVVKVIGAVKEGDNVTVNIDAVNEVIKTVAITKDPDTAMNISEIILASRVLVRLQNSVISLAENITKAIASIKLPDNVVMNISESIIKISPIVKEVNEVINLVEDVVTKITAGVVAAVKKGLRTLDKGVRSLG